MDSKEHTFILSLKSSAEGMNESRVDDAERCSMIELIERYGNSWTGDMTKHRKRKVEPTIRPKRVLVAVSCSTIFILGRLDGSTPKL
jgi:hypothetical protein